MFRYRKDPLCYYKYPSFSLFSIILLITSNEVHTFPNTYKMFKSLSALLLISLTFTLSYCATPVAQCDNGIPLPLTAQVNDCEATPCELPQGSTAILSTIFESTTYTATTRPRVVATSLGITLDYPLDQTNGCDGFLNVQCPIANGDLVNYELQMPILSIYPKVPVQLEFSLLDENDEGLFCFVVDTQVV